MPPVTRLGDMSTGHDAFPPRPSTSASGDVFVEGIAAHRVGDSWAVHCNPVPVCHPGVLAAGSGTVFVNGLAVGRIGDPISCGDTVATGAGTVFAN